MAAPAEPLLPPEDEPRSRSKILWLGGGGIGLAMLAVAGALVLRRPAPPEPEASPALGQAPRPRSGSGPGGPSGARAGAGAAAPGPQEKAAEELYQAAQVFERAHPGDHERIAAEYRKILLQYPATRGARQAEEKYRAARLSKEKTEEFDFDQVRKDSRALAAAGHFGDAIEAFRTYLKDPSREPLRRRAEFEIGAIENASREAWNEAVARAGELCRKGGYAEAKSLIETLRAGAIPEVAARCEPAIGELREAERLHGEFALGKRAEDACRAFRQTGAPRLLPLVRARQYDQALKTLDLLAQEEAYLPAKVWIAREREGLSMAAAFWEGFLKGLRSRIGQEGSLLMVDKTRIGGKLARLQPDRAVFEANDVPLEALYEQIHLDQIVAWTFGRGLPGDDPQTYVRAALFFFCEGRDDLARVYFATAREMGARPDEAEKVFREGFLRAAAQAPKK